MNSEQVFLSTNNNEQRLSPEEIVAAAIEKHYAQLQTGIRIIVARTGLAEGAASIAEVSDEILQSTAETALRLAPKFDASRSARAWLLGIAANKVKEIRRRFTSENNHTEEIRNGDHPDLNASDPSSVMGDEGTTEDYLDTILYHSSQRDRLVDADPPADELLSLVNEGDRQILTLAYIDDLEGAEVAAAIGIKEGAAYMRIARAKKHLLQKYIAAEVRARKESRL